MIFSPKTAEQKRPDYIFRPEYQQRLKDYCIYRAEQLRAFLPALKFWGVEHVLDHYFRGLRLVCEEIDNPINDSELKSRNCAWLLSSNGCNELFYEDTEAIMQGLEPYLPDNILDIPAYREELRRKEEAEKARVKKIADDIARAEMQKRRAEEEAERQKAKRKHLAEELGLDVQVIENLHRGRE